MSQKKIEEAMNYAKKSLELENMHVTKKQSKLVKESLEGKISHEEFIKKALELANE